MFSLIDFPSLIGLLGVSLILLAYFFLQSKKVSFEGILYSFMNLIGAFGILFSLMFHWNTPSVVIEIAWISISAFGLFRALNRRKRLLEQQI